MTGRLIQRFCKLDNEGRTLLERAMDHLGLSARGYARIFKIARTIADLSQNFLSGGHPAFRGVARGWRLFYVIDRNYTYFMVACALHVNQQDRKRLTDCPLPNQINRPRIKCFVNLLLYQRPPSHTKEEPGMIRFRLKRQRQIVREKRKP